MKRIALIPLAALCLHACDDTSAVSSKPPYLTASQDVVDFGPIGVGEAEQRTVFFINKGDLPLTIDEPQGNLFGTVFRLILSANEVAPTDSVVLRVIFSPADPIDYETFITFPNDSANEADFRLTLRGSGKQRDPCKDKVCNAPPARICANSTTSRQYNPVGKCVAGNCQYDAIDETCGQFGCDETKGICAGDPCTGVACQTPPNQCFLAQGLCQNGACLYTTADGAECDDGNPCTETDLCTQGSCRGKQKACRFERPDECVDQFQLRRYDPNGFCNRTQEGACNYNPPVIINCTSGCETVNNAGRCKDNPCNTPYDDNNPCTEEYCTEAVGWRTRPKDNVPCVAPSGQCPQGSCFAGSCLSKSGVTCTAEYDADLCTTVDIPGICTGNGNCVVTQPPPEYQCPNCNGICIKCIIFQFCIPF